MKSYGSKVLVPVIGAFAEISSDVDAFADVIPSTLAADRILLSSTSAAEAEGMYKQRIRTTWGHAAHRGWARLLLDRRRDLSMEPGQLAAQVANSTTRSSCGTMATTITALGSSKLAPPTEARP